MKISAAGATDGGNIVLFWPDNLPDGTDGKLPDELVEVIAKSRDEGKLIWFPAGGDGNFNVDIFIDEAVPSHLPALLEDEDVIPRLIVRDVGYFGGMEYLVRLRDSDLPVHCVCGVSFWNRFYQPSVCQATCFSMAGMVRGVRP